MSVPNKIEVSQVPRSTLKSKKLTRLPLHWVAFLVPLTSHPVRRTLVMLDTEADFPRKTCRPVQPFVSERRACRRVFVRLFKVQLPPPPHSRSCTPHFILRQQRLRGCECRPFSTRHSPPRFRNSWSCNMMVRNGSRERVSGGTYPQRYITCRAEFSWHLPSNFAIFLFS